MAAAMNTGAALAKVQAGLARRRRRELAFRFAGALATTVGVVFLAVFFVDLFAKGSSAFVQTFVKLDVYLDRDVIAPEGEIDLEFGDFDALARNALSAELPGVSARADRRELNQMLSIGAGYQLRELLAKRPDQHTYG